MKYDKRFIWDIIIGAIVLIAVIVALTISSYSKLEYIDGPSKLELRITRLEQSWCALLHHDQPEDIKALEGLMKRCTLKSRAKYTLEREIR